MSDIAPPPKIARLSQLAIAKHARPTTSRRGWLLLALIVVLIAAGAAGAAWWYYRTTGVNIVAALQERPIDVNLYRLPRPSANAQPTMLIATGKIVSDIEVNVATKVSGQIVELLVEQGDRVARDEVLARVEETTFVAQRDEGLANIARLRSMAERAKAEITRTQAAVLQAEADHEFEQRNYERLARLGASNQASDFEVLSAKSRCDAARAAVGVARAAVLTATAAAAAAEAEVAAAEAILRLWQKRVDDCAIRAPIGGVILERNAQVGDFIAAEGGRGANANAQLVRIADMEKLRVEVDVSERDVGRLAPGQRARITPDAARDRTYDGHILWIDPLSNYAKAQVQVKVRIENPGPDLRVEGSAKVEFLVAAPPESASTRPATIWISKSAVKLVPDSDEALVFTVASNRAVARRVKVGTRSDKSVEILTGLSPGIEIVADNADKLEDGTAVRVMRTLDSLE